jgi:hypothetical protein
MAQNKVEKRKFIESIFSLEVFSKMLSHVRDDYSTAKKSYDLELVRLNDLNNTKQKLISQRDSVLVERASKVAGIDIRLGKLKDKKIELSERLKAINEVDVKSLDAVIIKLSKGVEDCNNKLSEVVTNIIHLEGDLKTLTNQYNTIGVSGDVCEACLTTVTHDTHTTIDVRKAKIAADMQSKKSQLAELISTRGKLRDTKIGLSNMLTTKQQNQSNHSSLVSTIPSILKNIEDVDEYINHIDDELKKSQSTATDFDSIIIEQDNNSVLIEENIKNILYSVNMYDSARFIVSEEGAKTFIIKKVLALLNTKLQQYITRMGLNYKCSFNQYFEEEITNAEGRSCSYFNFSGAERKSVDIACLLSFIDIRRMQGSVTYNTILYDELFDSSLDEKGIEIIFSILKERVDQFNESMFIITHRKSIDFFNDSNVVYLEKANGITRRVEKILE